MDLNKLKEELRRDEGFRKFPYKWTAGKWTIGYGHNLDANPIDISLEELKKNGISVEKAEGLLMHEIGTALATAKTFFPNIDSLTDARQRVLVNMAYNMAGKIYGFKRFKTALLNNDYELAAKEMKSSQWYQQVKSRAVRLEKMMREG